MQTKRGSFVGSGATGNQAITLVGFQPEFLILISNLAATDTSFNDGHMAIGMASGASDQQAVHFSDDGALSASNTARAQQSGKIISATNASGSAINMEAALVSFDSDGFTINWTVASASNYHYLAIAGADFQAHVDSFDMNGSTGNQTVTGVPFQPKAVLFFGTIDNTTEGAQAQARLSMGCATAASERWAYSLADQDAAGVSIAKQYFTESKCILRTDTSAVTLAADFVAFTSDGFTVDITTALACRMPFVCFGGSAAFHAGTVTQPTSIGTVAESGIGVGPDCVILSGTGAAALDTLTAHASGTIGWAVESLGVDVVTADVVDNVGTTDSMCFQSTGGCVSRLNAATNAAVTTANMDSLDGDGFTLDWTLTDATASIIGYLAMGQSNARAVGKGLTQSNLLSRRRLVG